MIYEDGDKIILDGIDDLGDHLLEDQDGNWIGPNLSSNIPNLQQEIDSLADPPAQNTDFAWCVRNREKHALNEVNGFRSCTLVNLAKIAVRLGRPLKFDPVELTFIDDEQANRLIWQPMREPWSLHGEKTADEIKQLYQ